MKNSKRTPRALKGAVLIMVMTVMFVLIFLLAGTIAVVYSAHNRAMVKYEESQAYYTARSLLDVYLDTLLKDNGNDTGLAGSSSKVTYYYIDTKVDPAVIKSDKDCKQGRAMELDLYAMAVSVAPKGEGGLPENQYPYTGKETGIWGTSGSRNKDQYLHDWVKQYILNLAIGDFTLNPGESLEQKRSSYASSNSADYEAARELAMTAINPALTDYDHAAGFTGTDKLDNNTNKYDNFYKQFTVTEKDNNNNPTDTIYYRVPANTFKNYGQQTTGGSYGKVADTFPDGNTDAIIKVQLLERTLKLSTEGEDFKIKFDKGNREKDHVKIQITVEVVLDGTPTTTSVIYANKYDPKPSNNNALTALGGIDTASSGFPVSGGMTSLDGAANTMLNAAAASGSIFVEGNLTTENGGNINLFEGESYTVIHDFNITNNMSFKAMGDKTFMYVGGKMNVNNGFTFGEAGSAHSTDLVVNYLNWQSNDLKVNGNMYSNVFDVSADGNFNKVTIGGKLYTNDIITRNDNNGNGMKVITAADNSTAGGAYTVQIPDSGFYNATITVGDKIIFKDYYGGNDGGNHARYNSEDDKALGITNKDLVIDVNTDVVSYVTKADNAVASTKIAKGSAVAIDYNDKDAFNFGTDFKKTFTMPDGKNIVLDTHQSKFSQYYPKECFDADSVGTAGSFKADDYYTGGVLDKSKLMGDTNLQTAEATAIKEAGAASGCQLPSGTPTMATNTTVSAGSYILNPGNVGNTTVDTSGGKVVIQLKAGEYSGTINVTGTGELKILVPSNASCNWGGSGNGFQVVYAETMKNGNSIYVGEAPTGAEVTTVPNIDVYAGAGSSIYVNEGGGTHSLLTGYIYGPAARVDVNMGKQNFTYYKDGQSVGSANYFVVGSVVCGEYKSNSSDRTGVAFIDRDAATKKPGEVNFAWTDVYFQRGDV